MEKITVNYAIILLLAVFISAVSQVLLKKEAVIPHCSLIEEYCNVKVITAYIMFFLSTFLSLYAYRGIPLSLGMVLEGTGYVYAAFFGVVIFKERLTKARLTALCLIITGILFYAVD